MTLEEAIADLKQRIQAVSPDAVIRVLRVSDEEASIRAYAKAELDVQVIFYDIATSLPPEE